MGLQRELDLIFKITSFFKQVMDGSNNNFGNTTMQTKHRKETILNKKSPMYRKHVVSSKHIYRNNETHVFTDDYPCITAHACSTIIVLIFDG